MHDPNWKLKILVVNTYHFRGGGDSTYTFNLADLLRSKGHEVAFFAMADKRNLPDSNSDLFVSSVDFRELNQRKNLLSSFQVVSRAIYSREARHKFSQLLDLFQPDIIHLQNIHAHITPSVIFEAKQRHLPLVWTLHDYKLICPNSHFLIDRTGEICEACGKGTYYQPVLKRCKKGSLLASGMASLEAYAHRLMGVREKVDVFLPPSTFLRDKLLGRGFPPDRIHHLPLFLPENMFKNGVENGGNGDYLLFLGKLDPLKGIRPLLEACRLVPEIKLILAGRVEHLFAEELTRILPPNAQYVGMKHGQELHQLLCNALAVVVPSLYYENQPFSILEAFASGKPVIASDLGGMTELVANGERGLLVRPGDIETLADAMRWIVAHPVEAKQMGQMGLRYALEQHTQDIHYQRLMSVYTRVLS